MPIYAGIVAIWLLVLGHFYYPVVQQPDGNYWYVSKKENVVTQFSLAENVTLLAHNYLAGEQFLMLNVGDLVYVMTGDGIVTYLIYDIDQYETISYTRYRDLETDKINTIYEIVEKHYSNTSLTLQTCLERNGDKTWGVTFLSARKLSNTSPFLSVSN